MKTISQILLFVALTTVVMAQTKPNLTLQQTLEKALSNVDLAALLQSQNALAESRIQAQRRWDNPELSLQRESENLDGMSTDETFLTLSQRIELMGSRKLRVQAAVHQKQAVAFENQQQERQVTYHLKQLFFETLHYQQRRDLLEAWVTRAQKLASLIVKRESEGLASGYDRRLLQRELTQAKTQLAKNQSQLNASWQQLAKWTGLSSPHHLVGDLTPEVPTAKTDIATHPTIQALHESMQAALLEERAAGKWLLPEITVEAGFKQVKTNGMSDRAAILGVRLPLPLLNRNKAAVQQARAQARIVEHQKLLTTTRLESQVTALREKIKQYHQLLATHQSEAVKTAKELVSIAQIAYQEGEMNLLNLLEAHLAFRDAELEQLNVKATLRKDTLELESVEGHP